MAHHDIAFSSSMDGIGLAGFVTEPDAPVRGLVVIAHGAGEHCRRYERFADALAAGGVMTLAYDHRGHGPAAAKLGDFGAAGWPGLVADLAQACAIARQRHPTAPLTLFGHSMGSFAAQSFLADHSDLIDAVILSGSADFGLVSQLLSASGTGAPSLTSINDAFEPARTPFDWLSRDEAEVDKYVADPLCGFDLGAEASASMIATGAKLAAPDAWAGVRASLPALVFSGDQDPIHGQLALFNSLVDKLKRTGLDRVSSTLYQGARHEMLNETNRDQVIADILAWLAPTSA